MIKANDGIRKSLEKDMEILYLGNLKTVDFDLKLPKQGAAGSRIRWSSGEERFLESDGTVHRPAYGMGNREVILTGTFSLGELELKKKYPVTILEQENPHQGEEIHLVTLTEYRRTKADRVTACDEADIRILSGNVFHDTQERMRRYLLAVDDDSMLYHFRRASGLDTRGAESPGGWDAEESRLKGHTSGHYLSAMALCYHATGDEEILRKAGYMVRELAKCQKAFAGRPGIRKGFLSGYSERQFDQLEQFTPYPKIWAPWYTYHKIMAGLLDCYTYKIEAETALTIAEGMGLWAAGRLSRLPKKQLERMWGMYIAGEFGGMNAVLAQLFRMTGRKELLECAYLFDNEKLYGPLRDHTDQLNGMHANQHIPQIIGAVEIYKATGDEEYLDIARTFWQTVTANHTYAAGGVGEREMFHGFREIGGLLTDSTQETCASYNMLKLTKELYQLEPDSRYMDYYERVLYNHILATPAEDDSGESTYFFPSGPGMKREFLKENSCCHGTGMESHFKYREGIYFRRGRELFINLYLPSGMREGNSSVRLEQIPEREQSFRITVRDGELRRLALRKPAWAERYCVKDGGAEVLAVPNGDGYLELGGDFSQGREIEVSFVPGFGLCRTDDEPERAAVQYGPFVLAALSEQQDFLRVSFDETDLADRMERKENASECFTCEGLEWVPLYRVGDRAYHTYVTVSFKEKEDNL